MSEPAPRKGQGLRLSTSRPLPPSGTNPEAVAAALEEHVKFSLGHQPSAYNRPLNLPDRVQAPIDLVVPGRWQPRSVFADPELGDLVESIGTHGVINPLLVFANEHARLELIAGERRLRAAKLAGLATVPVEFVEGDRRRLHEISLIDNLQRENLRPWEEGAAFERMISELGISEAELARRLGKNRAYIQQRRALAGAAPELQEALASEAISFGMARGILAGGAGDLAAQRAGLDAVKGQIKAGKPVTEATARKLAAEALVTVHTAAVKALGWNFEPHYSGHLVLWSAADRPRVVTERELIDLVASGVQPAAGEGPAPWEEDSDLAQVLAQRGYLVSSQGFEPWVCISERTSGQGLAVLTWWSGAEIPERARLAQAEIDALDGQAGELGWEARRLHSAKYYVKGGDKTPAAYSWPDLVTLVAQLHSGTATLSPRERCAQCQGWLDSGSWMYHGNQRIHTACKEAALAGDRQAILAQSEARPTAPRAAAPAEVPSWVAHIPEGALRALVSFLTDDYGGDDQPLDEVRAEFAEFIQTALEEYRV